MKAHLVNKFKKFDICFTYYYVLFVTSQENNDFEMGPSVILVVCAFCWIESKSMDANFIPVFLELHKSKSTECHFKIKTLAHV